MATGLKSFLFTSASVTEGGHFGREEPDFTWERTDLAAELRSAAGLGELSAERVAA